MNIAVVLPGATRMLRLGNGHICIGDGWGWIRRGAYPAFECVGIPKAGVYLLPQHNVFINEWPRTYFSLSHIVLTLATACAVVTFGRRLHVDTNVVERTAELVFGVVCLVLLGIALELTDSWTTSDVYPLFLVVAVTSYAPLMLVEMAKRNRRRREASGLCGRCSYDLRGNVSGICPECGTPVTAKPDSRASG